MTPADWQFEERLWAGGRIVAGVDEAGRGPLAGPVVAAAVIFPCGCKIPVLDDSKRLRAARREELFLLIQQEARTVSWAALGPEEIDSRGILQATFAAMTQALQGLAARPFSGRAVQPSFALIDGPHLPPLLRLPAEAVIGGDGRCGSIAAASIIAKVIRDGMMRELHKEFPHYGFDRHKGYATPDHLAALAKHGPCLAHRRSFTPVRDLPLPLG